MPIHDWSRTFDVAWLNLQLDWMVELCRTLNSGVLPTHFYAMKETLELRPEPGFCTMAEPDGPYRSESQIDELPDAFDLPPKTSFRISDERRHYACKAISVRNDLHVPVAAIFFITRQDRETPFRLEALLNRIVGSLTRGIHTLVIDLVLPSQLQPNSIHQLIWNRLHLGGEPIRSTKPLTLASYSTGEQIDAYIETLNLGDELPKMPLFLASDRYVNVPLEPSYQASWNNMPRPIRDAVERPGEARA